MLPHAIANYEPYLYLRFFSTMPIIHCKCRSTEISIITFLLYILMIRLYHYACIFPILKIVTKSQIVHTNGIYNVLRTAHISINVNLSFYSHNTKLQNLKQQFRCIKTHSLKPFPGNYDTNSKSI